MKREYVGVKDPIGEDLFNMYLTDEEIIRCKDCKFWQEFGAKVQCTAFSWEPLPYSFCSRGERRE